MVLIYPSQGGWGDCWHMGNFKFQSFSWVLKEKASENSEREIISSYPQQSLNHEEHHGWIRGSIKGLLREGPDLADMVLVSPPRETATGINECTVLGNCLPGMPQPWVMARRGLRATWVLTRPLKASSFPPEEGLTWLWLQTLSTTS